MMMLLQCPRSFRSPSRNQTPGTICFTVPGCASPAAIKNASVIRTAKVPRIHMRRFIVVFRSPDFGCGRIEPGGLCYRLFAVKSREVSRQSLLIPSDRLVFYVAVVL